MKFSPLYLVFCLCWATSCGNSPNKEYKATKSSTLPGLTETCTPPQTDRSPPGCSKGGCIPLVNSSKKGLCQAQRGDPCTKTEDCEWNSHDFNICKNKVCEGPKTLSEKCSYYSSALPSGGSCQNSRCRPPWTGPTSTGAIKTGTCQAFPGEKCNQDSDCYGNSKQLNSCQNGTCMGIKKLDDKCIVLKDSEGDRADDCYPNWCTKGVCKQK